MEKNEIILNLENIFSKFLRMSRDELSDEISVDEESKWDSVTHLKMISEIENRFNIKFDIDEIIYFENIGIIKREVLKKIGAK